MKYCPCCGADLPDGAISFCAECGKTLPERTEQAPAKETVKPEKKRGPKQAASQRSTHSRKKKKLPTAVKLNGIKFVGLLKKHGYAWQSGEAVGSGTNIMEQIIKDAYAYVIAVNHLKKTLGIYPLEIYAPGSPTANAEKYKKVVDRCGNFADLKNDLISIGVRGEKTC